MSKKLVVNMSPDEKIQYVIETAMKETGFDKRKNLDSLDIKVVTQEVVKIMSRENLVLSSPSSLQ